MITAAHSRFTAGRMIPARTTEDLLLGSWALIRQLGRVPQRLIWDNETGIGRGGRLADGVAAFTGTLATQVVQLRPRDPESKGIVEQRNGYFETSFMPGRSFASPADFNAQFTGWLDRANDLSCGSMLGVRAHSPCVPVHGPRVRLAFAPDKG